MIFVTVGTQKFQMNRLLKAVDELVRNEIITDSVFMQTGHSDYVPQYCQYQAFLTPDEMQEKICQAEIVITHGGTGAIIEALKAGKKVVAVTRLAQFGEHVDDHQKEIVDEFCEDGLILGTSDESTLPDLIDRAKNTQFMEYKSGNAALLNDLTETLKGWQILS